MGNPAQMFSNIISNDLCKWFVLYFDLILLDYDQYHCPSASDTDEYWQMYNMNIQQLVM